MALIHWNKSTHGTDLNICKKTPVVLLRRLQPDILRKYGVLLHDGLAHSGVRNDISVKLICGNIANYKRIKKSQIETLKKRKDLDESVQKNSDGYQDRHSRNCCKELQNVKLLAKSQTKRGKNRNKNGETYTGKRPRDVDVHPSAGTGCSNQVGTFCTEKKKTKNKRNRFINHFNASTNTKVGDSRRRSQKDRKTKLSYLEPSPEKKPPTGNPLRGDGKRKITLSINLNKKEIKYKPPNNVKGIKSKSDTHGQETPFKKRKLSRSQSMELPRNSTEYNKTKNRKYSEVDSEKHYNICTLNGHKMKIVSIPNPHRRHSSYENCSKHDIRGPLSQSESSTWNDLPINKTLKETRDHSITVCDCNTDSQSDSEKFACANSDKTSQMSLSTPMNSHVRKKHKDKRIYYMKTTQNSLVPSGQNERNEEQAKLMSEDSAISQKLPILRIQRKLKTSKNKSKKSGFVKRYLNSIPECVVREIRDDTTIEQDDTATNVTTSPAMQDADNCPDLVSRTLPTTEITNVSSVEDLPPKTTDLADEPLISNIITDTTQQGNLHNTSDSQQSVNVSSYSSTKDIMMKVSAETDATNHIQDLDQFVKGVEGINILSDDGSITNQSHCKDGAHNIVSDVLSQDDVIGSTVSVFHRTNDISQSQAVNPIESSPAVPYSGKTTDKKLPWICLDSNHRIEQAGNSNMPLPDETFYQHPQEGPLQNDCGHQCDKLVDTGNKPYLNTFADQQFKELVTCVEENAVAEQTIKTLPSGTDKVATDEGRPSLHDQEQIEISAQNLDPDLDIGADVIYVETLCIPQDSQSRLVDANVTQSNKVVAKIKYVKGLFHKFNRCVHRMECLIQLKQNEQNHLRMLRDKLSTRMQTIRNRMENKNIEQYSSAIPNRNVSGENKNYENAINTTQLVNPTQGNCATCSNNAAVETTPLTDTQQINMGKNIQNNLMTLSSEQLELTKPSKTLELDINVHPKAAHSKRTYLKVLVQANPLPAHTKITPIDYNTVSNMQCYHQNPQSH